MNIGISAYKQLTKVSPAYAFNDKGELKLGITQFKFNPRSIYSHPYVNSEQHYISQGDFHFYSNEYKEWRMQLATLLGCSFNGNGGIIATPGPFYEILHIADNSALIDGGVALKLLKDFEQFRHKALELNSSSFLSIYDNFMIACKIAATNGIEGAVSFN